MKAWIIVVAITGLLIVASIVFVVGKSSVQQVQKADAAEVKNPVCGCGGQSEEGCYRLNSGCNCANAESKCNCNK